jgi:hypothetical protein
VIEGFRSVQGTAFILRGPVAVPRDVGKPDSDEMMGEWRLWHPRSVDDKVCTAAFHRSNMKGRWLSRESAAISRYLQIVFGSGENF